MSTLDDTNVKISALGGVGEVGKNLYIVEIDQQLFIVDAGLMYPENEMLGIDAVIPDITYIIENKKRLKAIFLTHGHEDQIGAIPYIVERVSAPIYGTALTIVLVKNQMDELGVTNKGNLLKIINHNSELAIGNVIITFFRTIHSIPDSIGICFDTPHGAIVHTGDFKFDQTPVGPYTTDIGKIANIGAKGVLCLLSDSTNAEKLGFTNSEAVVSKEIRNVYYNAQGRVIVCAFSTNITRIQQIIDVTRESGRKLVIVGKQLFKIINESVRLGFLHSFDDIIVSEDGISQYPDNELTILSLSTQAEPMKELAQMARQTHKLVKIKKNDTVIIAASPLPGNEVVIAKTVDLLFRAGANVIYGKRKVHVSGHGSQEDLKLMLHLTNPKYFLPVRGDYKMQMAHAKLGETLGLSKEHIILLEKGSAIEFLNGELKEGTTSVPFGNTFIDGLGVGDVGNIVLRDRRLLSQDGILVVVVTLNKELKTIAAGPEIISRGFVYVRESEALIIEATSIVKENIHKSLANYNMEWASLKQRIREDLLHYVYEKTKRRPMILPIIMEV